ncbi:hypothetical protein BH09BAC1_BH09BAC1_14500 [soil metagenome]
MGDSPCKFAKSKILMLNDGGMVIAIKLTKIEP